MVKRYGEGLPKRAIVIGASSGIGLAVARLLLRDGWKVGVAARRKAPLEALKKGVGRAGGVGSYRCYHAAVASPFAYSYNGVRWCRPLFLCFGHR